MAIGNTPPPPIPFLPGIAVAALSDVGCVRTTNEDSFAVSAAARLLVVADGVGGHGMGDRASSLAVATMLDHLTTGDLDEHAAEDAARAANDAIFAENRQRLAPVGQGMGTTVTGVWFPADGGNRAIVFSAGDSRVYRLRGASCERLTHDHSLYQDWLDHGQVGVAPRRNIITRCLGVRPDVQIDTIEVELHPSEVFLLCSDGLTGMIADDEILDIASGSLDVCEKCFFLISAAIARGARDNVTIIVASLI